MICGYIHTGDEPPEKCPACGAGKESFVEVDEQGKQLEGEAVTQEGDEVSEPVEENDSGPEQMAEKENSKEKIEVEEEKAKENSDKETDKKPRKTFLDFLGKLILKFHIHPIAVHTPNGILPMAIFFMALAIMGNYTIFEPVSFYSLAFTLALLPVVVFTGYMEWQMRYKGAKTALFITKIFCSLVVLATVSTLVIWRLIDPDVASLESPLRMSYFIVGLVALVATGIAGHLGGKLVFAGRKP